MKQTVIVTLLVILLTAGMLAAIVWGSQGKKTSQVKNSQDTIETKTPDEAKNNGDPIFYYGNTCPHCADVEKWMKENKLEEKVRVVKKEVYDNKANALELSQVAQKCGISADSIGVPFLYTPEGKCLIGTPDIIDYFSEKLKAASESSTLSK